MLHFAQKYLKQVLSVLQLSYSFYAEHNELNYSQQCCHGLMELKAISINNVFKWFLNQNQVLLCWCSPHHSTKNE